jgi:CheY-like chemotaxis protein
MAGMVSRRDVFTAVRTHASRLRGAAPGPPANILIVDDEVPILLFVDRVLRDAGYRTGVARDAADALEVHGRLGPFDLLLTDVRMPEMNGDELARRLRVHEPDLRVLYFTGFCDQLFKDKGLLWEGEAFLEKPCTVPGLLEAVSLVLYDRVLPGPPRSPRAVGVQPAR